MAARPVPDHASGPREIGFMAESDIVAMLQRDHARMRKAGGELAEAALRVIHDYDGLHRLSLAVAAWSTAIANEGDRPHRISQAELDGLLVHDIERGLSLRACAKRHGVGIGRVRGATIRARQALEAKG